MKQLIKKEFILGWKWYNYLFFVFPLMLLIPAYPAFTAILYIFFFVTTLFPSFLTNNDFKFMTGLPIRRRDIVASKYFDVLFGQFGTLILAIPLAAIKVLILEKDGSPLLDPNFAFFGLTLIEYTIFNLVFFRTYFTELKLPKSMLLAILTFFLSLALPEILIQAIPPVRAVLDSTDPATVLWRLLVLFCGIAVYIGGNVLSFRIACKRFECYNM